MFNTSLFLLLYVCCWTDCWLQMRLPSMSVLFVSVQICRSMNGARFTGCKSAKDRTAMAVTLEQVHLLQREHNLASDVFLHALECFRRYHLRHYLFSGFNWCPFDRSITRKLLSFVSFGPD